MFEGLFQPLHLIVILAIALIIFGPGKLPELGKGLGNSIREFKKAMSAADTQVVVAHQSEGLPKEIASPISTEAERNNISEEAAVTSKHGAS